jgi:hypothetical protein
VSDYLDLCIFLFVCTCKTYCWLIAEADSPWLKKSRATSRRLTKLAVGAVDLLAKKLVRLWHRSDSCGFVGFAFRALIVIKHRYKT